jgi:hypothetical protein
MDEGYMRLAVDTGEEGVNTGCVNTCLIAGVNTYQHLPKSGANTPCTHSVPTLKLTPCVHVGVLGLGGSKFKRPGSGSKKGGMTPYRAQAWLVGLRPRRPRPLQGRRRLRCRLASPRCCTVAHAHRGRASMRASWSHRSVHTVRADACTGKCVS